MTTSRWRARARSTALMKWCETHGVEYVFGFECNDRLPTLIRTQMQQAQAEHRRTGKAARFFTEFENETGEVGAGCAG